jgi:hypothetical protein
MIQRLFRASLGFVVLSVSVAACSASAPEGASESEPLITKCPAGYQASCDTPEGLNPPRVVCSCVPFTFYDVANAPTAGADTCGTTPVPVPTALAPYGCTLGIMVDHVLPRGNLPAVHETQPVWMCPVGTPLPHQLGVVSSPAAQPLAACNWVDGIPHRDTFSEYACEAVEGLQYNSSNCLGSAPSGWIFVLDTEFRFDTNGGGGCTGQCATGVGPKAPLPAGDTHG